MTKIITISTLLSNTSARAIKNKYISNRVV